MSLLSILSKGFTAMVDEALTPESFKKGETFENYIRDYLFVDKHYSIVERTHNYTTNLDYVESSLKPDFTFRDKVGRKEFYIEAKFRTGAYSNKIIWCNETQLARYRQYSKERPFFLLLGRGNNPKCPDAVSLIPIAQASYTGLFLSHIEKFSILVDKPVLPKTL